MGMVNVEWFLDEELTVFLFIWGGGRLGRFLWIFKICVLRVQSCGWGMDGN